MKYSPINKDWFYSYVDIPNLKQIQEEMLFFHSNVNSSYHQVNQYYINLFKESMDISLYPQTIKYLKSVGIYEKFSRILLTHNNNTTSPVVHIDTVNPLECQFSLNVPLQNCEGTFTAFYNTEQEDFIKPAFPKDDIRHQGNFAWLNALRAKEIARVETVRPMLVNTTVLHRAISERTNRALCCFRFKPELTSEDIKRMGINKPFQQVD